MRRPALLCTLLFVLLTTACGGSGGRASESGSVPAKGPTSVAIATERTGAGSAAVITRAEGGWSGGSGGRFGGGRAGKAPK